LRGDTKHKKNKMKQPEEPQSETDDDEEVLDNMYVALNYGTGKDDDKHAQNMLKRFKEQDEKD